MKTVYLKVGDVIRNGDCEWVVDMVNDCRARARRISKTTKTFTNRFTGETRTAEFTPDQTISVSNRIESDCILRNDKQLALSRAANKKDQNMSKNSKTNKASTKTEKTEAKAPGALGGLFGFSITSVLRALGAKTEASTAHIRDAMAAMGDKSDPKFEVSPTTVSIQVNNGRNKKGGDPAELTQAQIKQILAAAPDPEIAKQAEREAKEKAEAEAKEQARKEKEAEKADKAKEAEKAAAAKK